MAEASQKVELVRESDWSPLAMSSENYLKVCLCDGEHGEEVVSLTQLSKRLAGMYTDGKINCVLYVRNEQGDLVEWKP